MEMFQKYTCSSCMKMWLAVTIYLVIIADSKQNMPGFYPGSARLAGRSDPIPLCK
jgi:hypothetical protein